MDDLTAEELIKQFGDFLDEKGMYWTFVDWMKEKGYTDEEIEKFV